MNVRPNYAEGKFYSADKNELVEQIEQALKQEYEKIDLNLSNTNIIGGVVPHAGHIYSSPHTVHFFEIVRESKLQFDVVIIVNPNHTGKGLPVSIDKYDYWKTALGISAIDMELDEERGLPSYTRSQPTEHSAEVI